MRRWRRCRALGAGGARSSAIAQAVRRRDRRQRGTLQDARRHGASSAWSISAATSSQGLAREAALKLLELTDGRMSRCSDSPLGFRHGPKTFVNDRTLVVVFLSNDAYTRRYDLDLLDELRRDGRAGG